MKLIGAVSTNYVIKLRIYDLIKNVKVDLSNCDRSIDIVVEVKQQQLSLLSYLGDAFVVFLPRVVFVKIIAVAVAVQLFVAVPLYWPFHYFVWQYLLHYLLLCLHQVVHFEEVLCATQIGCLYRQFRYHPYHCFYTPFAAI